MKFVDLKSEYEAFSWCIKPRWDYILRTGKFLFGNELVELETCFPETVGKKYGVVVGSGTDALMLVLKYIYKEGMPIILPNFGAYPTATVCRHFTDKLYYIDVDASMTIDVNKLPDVKNGIIVPVHLFGNNCQMKKIMQYAISNNHIVVEDCAQSTGSGSGQFGNYSIFSFYPTKPLAAMGDGGIICTNNLEARDWFKKARMYGVEEGVLGYNSRMNEFQAAVVNCKMSHFKCLNDRRIEIVNKYKEIVSGYKVNSKSVYHQFTVRFKNREKIIEKLISTSIPYMIHYSKHVNELPILKGSIPSEVNYRVNDTILSLPIHPYLKETEIEQVMEFLYENRKEEIKNF